MSEQAKAETARPGDRIYVGPVNGMQTITEVEIEGREVWIWYAKRGEHAWSRGHEHDPQKLVERRLRPFRKGQKVTLERGAAGDADTLKDELARDVAASLKQKQKARR